MTRAETNAAAHDLRRAINESLDIASSSTAFAEMLPDWFPARALAERAARSITNGNTDDGYKMADAALNYYWA